MGALGFLVASAYWPGIPSAAFIPRWAAIAVLLPIVFRLDPRLTDPVPGIALLTLIGLGALSLRMSPDPLGGMLDLFYMTLLCGVFLAGAGANEGDSDRLLTGMGVGLALQVPLAIAQTMMLHAEQLPQASPFPGVLFYTSECYAEFAALVFLWAALRRRWWIALSALPGIALTHSRIALGVIALGMTYAWRSPRWWMKPALMMAIGIVGIAALFVLGVPKIASAGQRIVLWLGTIEGLSLTGHGLGWFYRAHPIEQFAHSDALQAVAEIGPGALLLLAIPIWAWWRRGGNLAERAVFVGACIEVLVSFPLHFPATGFVAAFVAGRVSGARVVVQRSAPVGRAHHGARLLWA